MKNKYEPIKFGIGEEFATKEEATKYAKGELTKTMQKKLGKYLLRAPEVIDGGCEGLIYLRLRLSDMYIE